MPIFKCSTSSGPPAWLTPEIAASPVEDTGTVRVSLDLLERLETYVESTLPENGTSSIPPTTAQALLSELSCLIPPKPAKLLDSLPTELISLILPYLDPSATYAFARTSRRYCILAEDRVWRDSNLVTREKSAYLNLAARGECIPRKVGRLWRIEKKGERRIQQAELTLRACQVLYQLLHRQRGAIEHMRIIRRPGSHEEMSELIAEISASLKSLSIITPRDRDESTFHFESIYYELLINSNRDTSEFNFPHLTHICFVDSTPDCIGIILRMCNSAPNLTSLVICF